ncbi:MAG: hypothetical protein AUH41_07660 [Gemmatimonadetes bacterium 13_1_40CM_66_11]|nr:MAG: hypothetical protein AUH41_07660 [Gemmatimonadetes bacterium 13_1_40CM_66_11]
MTFKPAIWYRIAVVLSVANLVGAAFAVGQAQPSHAMVHAGLALAFGLWAQFLRPRPGGASSRLGSKGSKLMRAGSKCSKPR